MVDREKFESVVDYTTVLSNFEGPLDLLLCLITRAEIDVKDIFVSDVTDQFLDYMKGLPYLDVEKVTEYLAIAAQILRIKAAALVPNLEEAEEIPEEDDERTKLIRAIEDYRLIKEEISKLKELETVGYYFKEPDKSVGETKTIFTLDGVTADGLIEAFTRLMRTRERAFAAMEAREIPRDEYTVEQKITAILEACREEAVSFESLFSQDSSKSEIITTFQALLELLKHQFVFVQQFAEFGEITITRNPEGKEESIGQLDEYD